MTMHEFFAFMICNLQKYATFLKFSLLKNNKKEFYSRISVKLRSCINFIVQWMCITGIGPQAGGRSNREPAPRN